MLEFLEETEETFFHAVITDVEPSAPQFKLAPTYTLYLAARYRASTHYRPELQPTERAHRLTVMLANVAGMIQRVIQVGVRRIEFGKNRLGVGKETGRYVVSVETTRIARLLILRDC